MKARYLLAAALLFHGQVASAASFRAQPNFGPAPYNTNVTQRAPTPADDWTKGYYSQGGIAGVIPATLGAGCTAATVSIAAPTSGTTATATPVVIGGQVVNYRITNPGSGYTASPAITVTGTGCSTAPAASAQLASYPLWNYGGTIYIGTQTNMAGQARWQPIQQYASYVQQANQVSFANGGQLPCDAGSNLECFSMKRARAGYNGNILQLTRVSDSTTANIGLLSNGNLDTDTADQFCYNTVCKVTIWYNQSSYTGATPANFTAAAASAPLYSPTNKIGDTPSLVFPPAANGATQSSYMSLTNTATTYEQGNGGCVLYRSQSAYRPTGVVSQTGGGTAFTLASAGQGGTAGTGLAASPYTNTGSNQSALNLGESPRQTPSEMCWRTTNAAATFYPNDKQVIGPAFNASTLTATTLGASNTTTPEQYMEISALVIAQENNWAMVSPLLTRASLIRTFGLTPQVRGLLYEDGDSITEGAGAQYGLGYTRYVENLLAKPINIAEGALYGDTIAHRLTVFGSNVGPAFDMNAANNFLSIFAGCNDIQGSVPAATAYQNLTAYVALAHQLGVRVGVGVMLPRGDLTTAQQTQWQAYQALIRANTAAADLVIDYAADPYMGVFANTSNTTFYQADTIHPSPISGYEILAAIQAASLVNVLQ